MNKPTKLMNRFALTVLSLSTLAATSAFAAELKYAIVPNFFEHTIEDKPIGGCHGGVVIDKAGNYLVTTDTKRGILVFSKAGKFQRAFGPSHIHALELREEDGVEYIYAARPNFNEVVKLKLDGEQVWSLRYPAEATIGETPIYKNAKEFKPCAVTVAPDGSIFAADGYGKNYVVKYDKDRKFVKAFGGAGAAEGKFKTCHGIGMDTRGAKPLLLVCNRNSNRVEHWDLGGNFVKVIQKDLRMPAAVHIRGDLAVFPELQGRVTVIDKDGAIVAQVGDNPIPGQRANYGLPQAEWKDGICNSPHGASIDKDGSLIVAEWSAFGHLHKFAPVK